MNEEIENNEESPLRTAFETALKEHGAEDLGEEQVVESKPEPEVEPQPTKQEEVAKPQEEAKPEPEPVVEEPAPPFWKENDKQLWSKIPPEARPIIKKYEEMRNRAISQYKQAVNDKIGQWADTSFEEVFPPERMRALRLEGKTAGQVTKALWEWNDFLDEDPEGAILEIMGRYNLTPEILAQRGLQPPVIQQPLQDPRVDMLLQREQQMQENQEKETIKRQLDAFGQETRDGRPLRPYWTQVKSVVGRLLPLVYQENPDITDYEALQHAYERAVYADPQVRTKLVSTQQNAVKFSDDKTLKAKEAASSLTGNSSSSTEPPKTPRSAREALEMAWKIHSR